MSLTSIEVTFPIAPVSASRPRVTRFHTYYPKKYTQFKEDMAQLLMLMKRKIKKLDGPVVVEELIFGMKVPKSLSKPKKEKLNGTWHESKPDLDNLQKAVFDALEGHYFDNDSQICLIEDAKKIWDHEGYIYLRMSDGI